MAIEILRTPGFKYVLGVCPENTGKEYLVYKEKLIDYATYQVIEFYFLDCMITAHMKMMELIENQQGE